MSSGRFSLTDWSLIVLLGALAGAGNASSVLGFTQFFVSGLAGMIVSNLQSGFAWPMAAAIVVGAGLALLFDLLAGRAGNGRSADGSH